MKTFTTICCERCDVEVGCGINEEEAIANALTQSALIMDAFVQSGTHSTGTVTVALCECCKGSFRDVVHVTLMDVPPMLVPGQSVVHIELRPDASAAELERVAALAVVTLCASDDSFSDALAPVFAQTQTIVGISVFPPSGEEARPAA